MNDKNDGNGNGNQNDEPHVRSQFLDLLETENGRRVAEKLLEVFESIQHKGTEKDLKVSAIEQIATIILIALVIGSVTWLTYAGKFTPSLGVLFGTLVGYVYGKNNKS